MAMFISCIYLYSLFPLNSAFTVVEPKGNLSHSLLAEIGNRNENFVWQD